MKIPRSVLIGFVLFAVAALPASAATPKPWQWTPSQTARAVTGANPELWGRETADIVVSKCVGKGPSVKGRYFAFRCPAAFKFHALRLGTKTGTVFVKVRRVGKGLPCVSNVSFAAIPAGCLATAGNRVLGDRSDARAAVSSMSPQTECAGYGAGFFLCWLGSSEIGDPASAKQVTLLATGAVVK